MRQSGIHEYSVLHHYIPLHRMPSEKKGLAERLLKKRLEQQGWKVWRAALIGATVNEHYPTVRKKYGLLHELIDRWLSKHYGYFSYINAVHHGMPDFICFRYGVFKFVECKLCHEQLLSSQKKCIALLQKLGMHVEVHKLVDHRTKTRIARINLETGEKKKVSIQQTLRSR